MTKHAKILELPIYLVGAADQAADWLRQAGIPVVCLGQESAMKSAFGLKTRRTPQPMASPARCLLFDSRDVWSRTVLKSYQQNACSTLDIARLLSGAGRDKNKQRGKHGLERPVRLVFLEQLKKSLEAQGGLWARLADYPFPYQGVGCLKGGLNLLLPNAKMPSEKLADPAHRLDLIQQRYLAGLPVMISATDLSGLADLPPVTGLESRGLPLLWRAEQTDFAQWWQHRNLLELTLWQTPTHYHVSCSKAHTSFCPVLEIWRGNHMASVPLRSASLVVRKDGLVFQQQPIRHPAGFTAGWPDSTSGAGISCLSA